MSRNSAVVLCLLLVLVGCNIPPVVPHPPTPRSNQVLLRSTNGYDGEFAAALSMQGFIVQPISEMGNSSATEDSPISTGGIADSEKTGDGLAAAPKTSKISTDKTDENLKEAEQSDPDKAAACMLHKTARGSTSTKEQIRACQDSGFKYELQLSITHDEHRMCIVTDGHRVSVVLSVVDLDTHKTVLMLRKVGLDRRCPPEDSVWGPLAQELRATWN